MSQLRFTLFGLLHKSQQNDLERVFFRFQGNDRQNLVLNFKKHIQNEAPCSNFVPV
jgi:hypothetical protein